MKNLFKAIYQLVYLYFNRQVSNGSIDYKMALSHLNSCYLMVYRDKNNANHFVVETPSQNDKLLVSFNKFTQVDIPAKINESQLRELLKDAKDENFKPFSPPEWSK